MLVNKDDIVVVLICGTSRETGSSCGCSCRDVYVFALTHDGPFGYYRGQRDLSARLRW